MIGDDDDRTTVMIGDDSGAALATTDRPLVVSLSAVDGRRRLVTPRCGCPRLLARYLRVWSRSASPIDDDGDPDGVASHDTTPHLVTQAGVGVTLLLAAMSPTALGDLVRCIAHKARER